MLRKSPLILAALSTLALQVHAGPDKQAWPLSNSSHRAYFCGGDMGGDNAPPAGYARAEDRALAALMKGKAISQSEAVRELQARARCKEIPLAAADEIELAPVGAAAFKP